MHALTVHNIPLSTRDNMVDIRRKVIITSSRPGTYPLDMHTLGFLHCWKLTTGIGRQDSDIGTSAYQASPYLINLHLRSTYVGKVACRREKNTQPLCSC